MDQIIDIQNVSMRFNLEQEKTDTIKEYVLKMLQRKLKFNEFYALQDVSFSVKKGESLALIGANGSGKSTMLKIIAGVLQPSSGKARIQGSIAPLIELGAGFDMDLTARENIFLNGAVLGYSRSFIEKNFDDIVGFAELEDFVDVPVKNYSSGMVARLGFSIATQVKADILIVDEILAVGDFMFQQKCYERMEKMLSGGTTLLFVSHDDQMVQRMCSKAVWLNEGRLMSMGPSKDVCAQYRAAMEANR